jgi:hypothetical protein
MKSAIVQNSVWDPIIELMPLTKARSYAGARANICFHDNLIRTYEDNSEIIFCRQGEFAFLYGLSINAQT